ncbi:hypothetical protein RUND412_009760 [Rhizina undulata]
MEPEALQDHENRIKRLGKPIFRATTKMKHPVLLVAKPKSRLQLRQQNTSKATASEWPPASAPAFLFGPKHHGNPSFQFKVEGPTVAPVPLTTSADDLPAKTASTISSNTIFRNWGGNYYDSGSFPESNLDSGPGFTSDYRLRRLDCAQDPFPESPSCASPESYFDSSPAPGSCPCHNADSLESPSRSFITAPIHSTSPLYPSPKTPTRLKSKFGPPRRQQAVNLLGLLSLLAILCLGSDYYFQWSGERGPLVLTKAAECLEVNVPAGLSLETTMITFNEDLGVLQLSASLDPAAWTYSSLAIAGINSPVSEPTSADSEVAAIISHPAQEPPKKSLTPSVGLPRCPWPIPTNPTSSPHITSSENDAATPVRPAPKAHEIPPPKVINNDSTEQTMTEARSKARKNRRLIVVGAITALGITSRYLRNGRRRRI